MAVKSNKTTSYNRIDSPKLAKKAGKSVEKVVISFEQLTTCTEHFIFYMEQLTDCIEHV